jgi:S1-C subfamily serine protease
VTSRVIAQIPSGHRADPAARAGITSGDVITAVDGHATPTTTALSRQISGHKPGQAVSVTLRARGGTHTVQVTLGLAPIS